MDTLQRSIRGLIAAALVAVCGSSYAGTMPNVQPISVDPVGVAPGGGIQARYTYEIRLPLAAANDAGATAAANEASYATRLVTIGRATSGGIIDSAVAVGSKLAWWATAAYLAYQAYKWYRDSNGNLQQQGQQVPSYDCSGGDYWQISNGSTSCSIPGMQALTESYLNANYPPPNFRWSNLTCAASGSTGANCYADLTSVGNWTAPHSLIYSATFKHSAPAGTNDPGYTTDPTPVPLADVGQMAEQHPDWWQGMLTDPSNGTPLITPEVAQDMDALKQQLAPQYGVDPTTLTPTQPDSQYTQGVADQRQPTALPAYCGWATAACDYYQWVEDHWPDKDPHTYSESDCQVPPSCSGDQVMCGVARNTWAEKCAVSGDGTQPPQFGAHVVSEIDQGEKDLGDTSTLDSSGLGWGTSCPFQDTSIEFYGQTIVIPFQPVCDYGPWMRALILILAGLKAAQIIAGLRDVAA